MINAFPNFVSSLAAFLNNGQLLKWFVYGLLIINFGFYLVEDLGVASQVLRGGGTLLQWSNEFSTTLDVFGWLGLLIVFEFETYLLSDETVERWQVRLGLNTIRLFCYGLLIHTVMARVTDTLEYVAVEKEIEVTSLCQLVERDFVFTENNLYTPIDTENCLQLARSEGLYVLQKGIVTDTDGYTLQGVNAWIDLQDVLLWLLIVAAIELTVYLQNQGVAEGYLMLLARISKVFYCVLFFHAAFWAYKGHWLWAWDQSLWILGFWAIENNLSEWRDEILSDAREGQEPAI